MFNLKDKVAIITGGAGTIGGSMAQYLAEKDVKVAILGRTPSSVEKKVKEIEHSGKTAMGLIADVLAKEELEKAKDKVLSKWGSIDILINAAGGNIKEATVMPEQSFFDMPIEAFDKVLRLNLTGTVLPCQVFGEAMINNENSCILNISSMAAQVPLTRVVGYSASKAAIDNFTKWLAVEMANKYDKNIRVNAIAPGFFVAKQNKSLLFDNDGNLTERGKTIINSTPMKRFGKIEELNSVVAWICSDQASFVTGTVIPIDGGFSAYSGV